MALRNLVGVYLQFLADGVSNSIVVNIGTDPIGVFASFASFIEYQNLVGAGIGRATAAYIQPNSPFTVNLVGNNVTVLFNDPPLAGIGFIEFFLLF